MKLCVTHFFNEEKLLPFWLSHHHDIFDHVVLIDHHSTDRSAELIRYHCPEWEVRLSQLAHFDAVKTDREVMEVEKEFSATWKIALNVTEFLVCNDLARAEALLARTPDSRVTLPGAIIVDTQRTPPDPSMPLVEQYTSGLWESEMCFECLPRRLNLVRRPSRSRSMHNAAYGDYAPGRHTSHLPSLAQLDRSEAWIAWFGFAPATPAFLQRKLQIQSRIPASDVQAGFGVQHLTNAALIEKQLAYLTGKARPLAQPLTRVTAIRIACARWAARLRDRIHIYLGRIKQTLKRKLQY